jgi:hypothetical protein
MSQDASPNEVVTSLQDLLSSIEDQDYGSAIVSCQTLLGIDDSKKNNNNNNNKKQHQPRPLFEDDALEAALYELLVKCWLHQDMYAKVLNCAKAPSSLHLYARYRLEDYASIISSNKITSDELLDQHLLAQALYNTCETERAMESYKLLLESTSMSDQEDRMELLTNGLAVLTANATPFVASSSSTCNDGVLVDNHEWIASSLELVKQAPAYYDLAYNLGTYQVLTGDDDENQTNSQQLLPQAESSCRENGQEDADLENELSPIQTNSVWSRHWKGLEVDASEYSLQGTEATKTIVKLNQVLASKSSSLSAMPTSPDSKFTALQTRMYWYNRSVIQLQQKDLDGCRQSCQSLQSTIVAPTKSQQKKNTKKSLYLPLSQDAAAWWNARVDVILAHVEANGHQEQAVAKLQHRVEALQALPESPIRDHALAHVQLHLFHFQTPKPTREQTISLLQQLPSWIQSKKATVATLASLTKQGDGNGSSSSDSNNATGMKESVELADVMFAKGDFAEAARLYEKYLPVIPKCNQDQLQQQARRVQALAQSDPQQATDLWESLQKSSLMDDNEPASLLPTMDGEALEQQELPRAKNLKSGLLAVPDDDDDTQRKSHEQVLRRRARQRETYLQEQEKKGLYNSSKPTKPNAERWIPKHARSSNRRRGGGGYHKGAQGGGSEKEALKLDAMARKGGLVDNGPSTANMKVSSGGRKAGRRK